MALPRRLLLTAAALLAVTTTGASAAQADVPTTAAGGLTMTSSPGDYIGQGQSYAYADDQVGNLRVVASPDHLTYTFFNGANDFWTASFSAPTGQTLTAGGTYPVQRDTSRTAGFAGLDVSGQGRGCNTLTGSITVNRYTGYRSGDTWFPRTIDISFSQHCESGTPSLDGRLVWDVTTSGGVIPAANIAGETARSTVYGATVPLDGFGPTSRPVGVWFQRGGTGGYQQRRSLTAAADGSWHTSYVAGDDYDVYASDGGSSSALVHVRVAPTIDGTATRVVRRGTTTTLTGTGIPGAALTLHYHRAGTAPVDYSLVRTVTVGANGRWSRPLAATTDYRIYASLPNGQRSASVLVQAR